MLPSLLLSRSQTRTWTDISFVGRQPPPRHSHLTAVHKDHLYLFGGLDELGAQSFAMYRVHLPPGENYTAVKPEWMEWDSELPYNKCRTCTLYNGTVSVYQVGMGSRQEGVLWSRKGPGP